LCVGGTRSLIAFDSTLSFGGRVESFGPSDFAGRSVGPDIAAHRQGWTHARLLGPTLWSKPCRPTSWSMPHMTATDYARGSHQKAPSRSFPPPLREPENTRSTSTSMLSFIWSSAAFRRLKQFQRIATRFEKNCAQLLRHRYSRRYRPQI